MQVDGNFDRIVGYRLIKAERGNSEVELEITDALKQRFGLLHGGVIATFADYCMGTALYSLIEGQAVTAQMNVNYVSSVRAGVIRGYGRIKKLGNRLSFAECEIKDEENRIIATASGVYYKL